MVEILIFSEYTNTYKIVYTYYMFAHTQKIVYFIEKSVLNSVATFRPGIITKW